MTSKIAKMLVPWSISQKPLMRPVIINSDDFGYSKEVNEATLLAFDKGLISSTTMLVNFEIAFEDAIDKATRANVGLRSSSGIHLNLTEGKPLTKGILDCERFCRNGMFHGRARRTPFFLLRHQEAQCVCIELDAQIAKLRHAGIEPTHIDSHHHIHTEWGLFDIVTKLAKAHGIPAIRISRNIGDISKLKVAYKMLFKYRLRRQVIKTTDYFGSLNDLAENRHLKGSIEIMVHARLKAGSLVDIDGAPLEEKIRQVIGEQDQCTSFGSDLFVFSSG